jgi:signal peptidase I
MQPTLEKGDVIFAMNSWISGDVERGDIVTFFSNYDDKVLVKRVIGLPGESVEINAGKVYINGELLEEDYLAEPMCPYDIGVSVATYEKCDYDTEVPDYLYDKEGNTIKWYAVDSDGNKWDVTGGSIYHETFQVPEDCYFMMGDNRNDSYDSRYWVESYVKADSIITKDYFTFIPTFSYIGKE